MEQYIIERRIMHAIDSLRMKDFYLLKHDCSERSIAHRLAIYIEQIFNGEYAVDCEYNRDGVDPKRLLVAVGSLGNGSCVYPDIIVHKRGTNDHNILAIELKKENARREDKDVDLKKLKLFTSTQSYGLHYKFGAYIEFSTSINHFKTPKIIMFSEGRKIEWGSNSSNYMNRW